MFERSCGRGIVGDATALRFHSLTYRSGISALLFIGWMSTIQLVRQFCGDT